MSENKQYQEEFDLWLASNLKTSRPVNPAFEQTVLKNIEYIKARKLLNQAVLQERKAKITLIITIIIGLSLIFYTPVLKKIYTLFESGFMAIIKEILNPAEPNLVVITLVLFVLCMLVKILWDKLATEI